MNEQDETLEQWAGTRDSKGTLALVFTDIVNSTLIGRRRGDDSIKGFGKQRIWRVATSEMVQANNARTAASRAVTSASVLDRPPSSSVPLRPRFSLPTY